MTGLRMRTDRSLKYLWPDDETTKDNKAMKKILIFATAALCLCAVTSCLDDDNNYNYKQVNELQGGIQNFSNFDDVYSMVQGDELTFEPGFKFTIDSISPDVSYSWYVNHVLQDGQTGKSFTFKPEQSGTFEVTFAVKDNKSDVTFAKSAKVNVRSVYQRGWTILANEGGRSVLHFIVPKTVKYDTEYDGKPLTRDSLVFEDVRRDIVPSLGTNPKGLIENIGYLGSSYGEIQVDVYDELVVMQDRWEELNGNTLAHEVYTDQEFKNDLPSDFSPVEASFNFSTKALLDKKGVIYWNNKGDAVDFHAGFYTNIGLNNNMLFSHLYSSCKLNTNYNKGMLALTKNDNSLVGIYDGAYPHPGTAINENSQYMCGSVYNIDSDDGEDHFNNIDKDVVDVKFSPYEADHDYTSCKSWWTALLRDHGTDNYYLRYFHLDAQRRSMTCEEYQEFPLGSISDFRGFTVFNNKRYIVFADGNRLYYCQMGWDEYGDIEYQGHPIALGSALPAKVKKLVAMDVTNNTYRQKYEYDGQLGVALDDGSFYIFGIEQTKDEEGNTTAVALKQHFPNAAVKESDRNFGNIVDVIYKWGDGSDMISFDF